MNSTLRDHPVDLEEILPEDVGAAGTRLKLLSFRDVLALPPPQILIKGLLTKGESSCIFGPSSGGKTFVALSIAFAIASGQDWYGHRVEQGPVVYVVTEGLWGIRNRVRAWAGDRLRELVPVLEKGFFVLGQSINLRDAEEVAGLVRAIEASGVIPSLIVLDTLARCMPGGEENSAKEMGELIAGCDALRLHFGATVMLVHHTGKAGEAERGSSALRGAMDSMFSVKVEEDTVRLAGEKQKDGLLFRGMAFHLDVVQVGTWPDGDPMTSCRLRLTDGGEKASVSQGSLRQTERALLETLRDDFGDAGASKSELREAYPRSRPSFYKALNQCLEKKYVETTEVRGVVRYRLAPSGRKALVSGVSGCLSESPETDPTSSQATPPPVGGGAETEDKTEPATARSQPQRKTADQPPLPGYEALARLPDDGGHP